MIDSQALMLEATQLNSSNKNLELWLLGVKCLGANLSSLRSPTLFQYIWCEMKGGRVAKQKKKGGKKSRWSNIFLFSFYSLVQFAPLPKSVVSWLMEKREFQAQCE